MYYVYIYESRSKVHATLLIVENTIIIVKEGEVRYNILYIMLLLPPKCSIRGKNDNLSL